MSASSILKATLRALDTEGSGSDDLDFDPHWPLSVAVALLDQASVQLEKASTIVDKLNAAGGDR